MLKIENTSVYGIEEAIRGMRNPMNSWHMSDSHVCPGRDFDDCETDNPSCPRVDDYDFDRDVFCIGPNDHKLAVKLAAGGPVHAKYRRMIVVYADITAPLYWWKEADTYKVGTVTNSCSTMHKIHAKEFTIDDFSHERLNKEPLELLEKTIEILNKNREIFNRKNHRKDYWYQMIQLLPSSYNQRRTMMMNYEVLNNIYHSRKNHKLDEWHTFCEWIEELPYSEVITK